MRKCLRTSCTLAVIVLPPHLKSMIPSGTLRIDRISAGPLHPLRSFFPGRRHTSTWPPSTNPDNSPANRVLLFSAIRMRACAVASIIEERASSRNRTACREAPARLVSPSAIEEIPAASRSDNTREIYQTVPEKVRILQRSGKCSLQILLLRGHRRNQQNHLVVTFYDGCVSTLGLGT